MGVAQSIHDIDVLETSPEATKSLREAMNRVFRTQFKPKSKLTLVEWADKYRKLPDNSAEPGQWHTSRVPPAKEPMLAISDDNVQEVTVMSCIQLLKALAVDTPILTSSRGWQTMGSLLMGDKVFGPDGKDYPVLHKSDVKNSNRCFKVGFTDGSSIVADAGHKWFVEDSEKHISGVLTTIDIIADFKPLKYNVPAVKPINNYCDGYPQRAINSIVEIPSVPVQCIAIDSPDHLYLAGKELIPTHNTELMLNTALYYIHQEPSPIMYVAPKSEIAQAWSKERFTKSANAIPEVKELMSQNRRDQGNTILQKQFPGGQLSIVSARNPDDLAMRACRVMLFDECDKYPVNVGAGDKGSGGEGDPIAVGWGRSTTYGRRAKKIVACSPTVENRSRIEKEFKAGSQHEFHQKCPHCDHAKALEWDDVVIPVDEKTGEKKPDEAFIVCSECGTKWTEGDRVTSIDNGYYVAKHPKRIRHKSYRVTSLSSPFTPVTTLADEFVKAGKDNNLLKAFYNTRMARTWKEKGEQPDWKRLYDRREQYKIAQVPQGGLLLTMGMDVQKEGVYWEVMATGRRKISWSVECGYERGDIEDDEFREHIKGIWARHWPNYKGLLMQPDIINIDSGYKTQAVYSLIRESGDNRVRAIKGDKEGRMRQPVGIPTQVDVNYDGKRITRGLMLWHVGSAMLKEQFYGWLDLEKPTDEKLKAGGRWPTGYCHFPEYDEEYFKSITAEQKLVTVDSKGYEVYAWEKLRDRNDFLDCRVYARAGAIMCGVDRMEESAWDALEAKYNDVKVDQAQQKTDTSTRKRRRSTYWEDR